MTESALLTPAQIAFLEKNLTGFLADRWSTELAGSAGSDRRFYRVTSNDTGDSRVLVVWDSSDSDWDRYLGIQREVSTHTDLLPGIDAWDVNLGLILEEDLGRTTLKEWCRDRDRTDIFSRYRQVIERLVQWHQIPLVDTPHVMSRQMDREMFLWESDYFTEHCVREFFGIMELPPGWDRERERLATDAAMLDQVCMHRDFQSENIMVSNGTVRFIDFQGARRGPAEYDLASLLWDPYMALGDDPALVMELFEFYAVVSGCPTNQHAFAVASIQRLLQALGAFANLSIHKGKDWYRDFIPVALRRLASILSNESSYTNLGDLVGLCSARLAA